MSEPTNVKPLLRGHFHQAMFFVALGALVPLLIRTHNLKEFFAILVYAICALAMFGISTLYHRINWKTVERRTLWKKLDHAGIYLMIAGCFTPVSLLALSEKSGFTIFIIIWSVAAVGIIQSFLFPKLPKLVSALIYIIAGYLIVPYVGELKTAMGVANIWLLFAGGISYTVGGICYGLKWPKLNPKYYGYHEVFHIFVNLGATLHFFVINSLIN